MREGLQWIVALRRFILLVGLAPLTFVWLLSGLGALPESGLAWGLAAVWPVGVVGLIWHYRSMMVLNDILTFGVMLAIAILAAPWLEARFDDISIPAGMLLVAGLTLAAFVLWMVLIAGGLAMTIRGLGHRGRTCRIVSRAPGAIDPAVAFEELRLVPGRSNAFYDCGPLQEDGWFTFDFHLFPYDSADETLAEDSEDSPAQDAENSLAGNAVSFRARILNEGATHQIMTVASDDDASTTTSHLQVYPQAGGCVVTTSETTDSLGSTGAAMMWLKNFGHFSTGSKLDHLAGRPCRFGNWTAPRGVLTDLGNWFARRAQTGQNYTD